MPKKISKEFPGVIQSVKEKELALLCAYLFGLLAGLASKHGELEIVQFTRNFKERHRELLDL